MFKRPSRCNWEPPQCAEVAGLDTAEILIRSSLDQETVVKFTRAEWRDLIEAVQAGEYELQPEKTAVG